MSHSLISPAQINPELSPSFVDDYLKGFPIVEHPLRVESPELASVMGFSDGGLRRCPPGSCRVGRRRRARPYVLVGSNRPVVAQEVVLDLASKIS